MLYTSKEISKFILWLRDFSKIPQQQGDLYVVPWSSSLINTENMLTYWNENFKNK